MIAVLPAVAAAVAAALCARVLTVSRSPGRPGVAMRVWALALAQFALASAALATGIAGGWSPALFRGYYLLGAVLNTVWLGLGSIWLLAPRRVARLATAFVLAATVLATVAVFGADLLPSAAGALASQDVPQSALVLAPGVRIYSRVYSLSGSAVVLGGLVWSLVHARARTGGLALLALGVAVVAIASELVRAGNVPAFSAGLALGIGLMYVGFAKAR